MKNLFYLFLFLLCSSAYSQSLSVFDVDTTNFPVMKAKFYAFDKDGNQLHPNVSDFSISENGLPRTVLNVTCPNPKPQSPLSSVLVFDVSGSMTGEPLDMEKEIANSWINMLNLGFSDCAITSFSDGNYINQDFTTNKNKLINGINNLGIIGGTDYNDAMINPAAGGILMAKTGKHKRIIIFLTDGQPNFEPRTQEIIDEANKNNISIYCLSINMLAHHSMVEFSTQTGGLYFENISSKEDAEKVMRRIYFYSQNDEPCEIDWQSEPACNTLSFITKINLKQNNMVDSLTYLIPDKGKIKCEFLPTYISLQNVKPGDIKDTTIIVTAKNADFNVTNIKSTNSAFTISPNSFILKSGQSQTLYVKYTAVDSGYSFTNFIFENNACPANYYISSIFRNKKPNNTKLKLTQPNGGEEFVIGSDTLITWEGIAATDTVKLEYSIDNGLTWKLITNQATGLKYIWKNIPKPESDKCKVRVKQISTLVSNNKPGTLQLTLGGHGSIINDISWSPDQKLIATSSWDCNVIIWDAKTGTNLITLKGHTYTINNFAWSPDGSKIATSSDDKTAIIWDVTTGSIIYNLTDHTDEVYNINWSPDGSKVATTSRDGTAIIWNVAIGTNLYTLTGHNGQVWKSSWSPDGNRLVTVSDDSTAIIWDASTGSKIRALDRHNGIIVDVNWSPDGTQIATASTDSTAIIWDAASGAKLHTFKGHNGQLFHVNWSPDGTKISTAGLDSTGIIWDVNSGTILFKFKDNNAFIPDIVWSPDGSKVVTFSDSTTVIWNSQTGAKIQSFTYDFNFITAVNWKPDGSQIVTGFYNKAIIWDVQTGKILQKLGGHRTFLTDLCWSPDDSKVATAGFDNVGIIWDAYTGANLLTLIGHIAAINNINWSPDGSKIATASYDSTVIIWDAITGTIIHQLRGHTNKINNVVWSPDGSKVASASDDGTSIIWDATTGTKLHVLNQFSYIQTINWSPDGSKVVTSGGNYDVKIWDVATGIKLNTLTGHSTSVLDATWSPDGSRIASTGFDKTVKIWDALSGICYLTLYGHKQFNFHVNWSHDGSRVVSASNDSTAIIWDAASGKNLQTLSGQNKVVYKANWSPDDKFIAVCGEDHNATIWDGASGAKTYSLVGHDRENYDIEWSNDGSRVATASVDFTAKIWFIENYAIELQEDESDSVFSIVAPHASANNIDMKECLVGMVKDSIIKNVIENIGSYPIRIDSIYFTGTDASNFRLLSHILPISIKPYDKISLEFGFGPSRVGLHSADIIILTQSDTLFKNIIGTGYLPQLSLKSKILDFGEVYIGSERTFTDTVLVKNISAVAIDISSSYQVGPDKTQFEIISGDGSFKLNPNEERKLTVRFKPSNAGRTTGGIAFEYNGVGSPALVTLFGEGKNKEPNLQSNMAEIPNLICTNVSQGRLSIKNKCTEIIYFSEINFKGNNAADFSVPNFEPFIIEPDSTKYVNIQFNPQFAGIRTAELEIKSTAEPDSVIKINLTSKKDSINISSLENTIDLGNLYLNQSKDSSITLKNYGTLITGASLNSSSNIEISKNAIELSVDETIKIPFKLKGQSNEGNINEKITFIDSICNINKEIKIIGTTSKANPHASIQVGSLEAYPGDTIEIPITFIDKNDLEIAGITSLNAELSYNSTLLLPIGYNPDFVEFSTSKIKLTNLPITNTEIAQIKFIAGLGNTELSILKLENVHPIGGTAKIETQPGIFKLLGVCPEGGNRLLNPSGIIKIASIKPNPSDNEIEVELELVEKTGYKLIIVNSNGQTVREIIRTNTTKGISLENIGVSELASGVYNLILQTESERISKLFLIMK